MSKDKTNPSPELYLKIIKRLRREERILAAKKIILFAIIFASSSAGLVSAFKAMVLQLQSSGFVSFVSLIFSDFDVIGAYWQNFCMAILQSIPAISIASCLAILIIVLQSARLLSKNIKTILNIKQLATNR